MIKSESKVKYSKTIDSVGYTMDLTIPIEAFAYISAKLANEIRVRVNVVDVDSLRKRKTVFSSVKNTDTEIFSGYNRLFPTNLFMDSLLYSKILPAKFDSSVSPIFINTTNGWLNFEKEVESIKYVTSLMRYEFPYLNGVDFRSGTVEHRVEIIDKDLFNIYTTHDFANPMMTKDFVIHNDSLVIKAERFEKVVKLNSGVFGYIISDVDWYFGEYRSGYCGGCMYSNDYLVTYQDLKLKKSNKLLLLHFDEFRARGVITFYKDMEIYLTEEGEDYPVNYNNFKNNIFTMKFSENKVVKIKVDEEKWRLIFIKNW